MVDNRMRYHKNFLYYVNGEKYCHQKILAGIYSIQRNTSVAGGFFQYVNKNSVSSLRFALISIIKSQSKLINKMCL